MSLPAIVIAKREPVRLVSPLDSAIDRATPDGRAAHARYLREHDPSVLQWREGETPTWFTLRALTALDKRLVRRVMPPVPDGVAEWEQRRQELALAVDAARVAAAAEGAPEAAAAAVHEALDALAAHDALPERADRADWWFLAGLCHLRVALVSVEGLPGWEPERERIGAQQLWSESTILAIDEVTLQWLGEVAIHLASLAPEKKSVSGSSPIAATGTP